MSWGLKTLRPRAAGLGILCLLVWTLIALPAQGVILYSDGTAAGASDAANRVAPSGTLLNSGWQYEGVSNIYNATAVAPNWMATANHLGLSVGSTFTYNSTVYHTIDTFLVPGTDIRLFKLDGVLSSYAPIYSGTTESGRQSLFVGKGKPRGTAVSVGPTLVGWQAGNTDSQQRWGTNTLNGTVSSSVGTLLYAFFDSNGGVNEGQVASGDSGGGMFISDNGIWKLAGINYATSGPYSLASNGANSFMGGIFNNSGVYENTGTWTPAANHSVSYFSRLSDSIASIDSAIGLSTWKSSNNGTWSNANNWTGGSPNGVDRTAELLNSISTARTVTIDTPVIVGTLEFNSPTAGYTVAASSTNNLTLDASATYNLTSLRVLSGAHTISAPVVANKNVQIDVQGSGLTLSGTFSEPNAISISKLGGGTLTWNGTHAHAVGTQFTASGGSTYFNSDGGANLAVTVNNGAQLVLGNGTSHHLASLTIGAGSIVTGPSGSNRVTELGGLAVDSTGFLDVADNDVVVHATGGTRAAVVASLRGSVTQGYHGGLWDGTVGITSSQAAQDGDFFTALAVTLNENGTGSPLLTSFNGITVGVNDILLKYTYYGDANLDGVLNAADFAAIQFGQANGLFGWSNGDFNYDGVINGVDFALLDNTYNFFPNVPLSLGLGSLHVVPEPSSLLLGMLGTLGLFGLVRRRCL